MLTHYEATLVAVAPFAIAMLAGGWLAIKLQRLGWRLRKRRWQRHASSGDYRSAPQRSASVREEVRTPDAAEQLRIVMTADFAARPLLNQSEARVFSELCDAVTRLNPQWRVMAQVSLGEILRSQDRDAYSCINAKRVDMLLVDENCRPRHAIEYHGDGHYQGTAAARDAVKKEALRRAGIGYQEVVAGQTTPTELRRIVENLVSRADQSRQ